MEPGVKRSRPAAPPPPPPKKPPRDISERVTVPVDAAVSSILKSSPIPTDRNTSPDDSSNYNSNFESESSSMLPKQPQREANKFMFTNPALSEKTHVISEDSDESPPSQPKVPVPLAVNLPKLPPKPPKPVQSPISKPATSMVPNQIDVLRPATKRVSYQTRLHRLGSPDPSNKIYHLVVFSELWWIIFLVLHFGQFSILLSAAFDGLPPPAFAVLLFMVLFVAALVLLARCYVKKSRLSTHRNLLLKGGVCTPEDEADDVSDRAILLTTFACVLEGVTYAIYSAVLAGKRSDIKKSDYENQGTILQTLRFSSIVLLALHRIFRPANRVDPMRTILELEIVTVCWDAIDGSTLYQLIESSGISMSYQLAAKVLMVFWYCSVGVRMALMLLSHLDPQNVWYGRVLMYPLQLAPQPTVDRSLQGIRLRGMITMVMSIAEFYAAAIRLSLWAEGKLDSIQQEMAIKNIFFLATFSGAYDMYNNSIERQWNSREIMSYPFELKYPSRENQLIMCRWSFVVTYLLIGSLFSWILIQVTPDRAKWVGNVVVDILLTAVFVIYCKNIHIKADSHEPKALCHVRQKFFAFPGRLGTFLGAAMVVSLLFVRIPALYYNYSSMASDDTVMWTFENGLLLISLSLVPMVLYSMYWSLGYMLFRKEFTAAPGNYNAIHDPIIQMVSTATMTEGVLDILSCSTFVALAANDLPPDVNGLVVIFALLEIVNACQSFALQCMLSGGHDDTPLDLVRWSGYLRVARVVIDAGAIILRVVLWIKYNAVSSVFLVKNLYNLIHTSAHVERWTGVKRYPKETLFTEFVSPQDWYGMTKEEWRDATSETLIAQARSGRRV